MTWMFRRTRDEWQRWNRYQSVKENPCFQPISKRGDAKVSENHCRYRITQLTMKRSEYNITKLKDHITNISIRILSMYISFIFRSISDCEKYLRKITTIVEEWMYTGPLKFRFYPNIPLGITAAFSNYCARNAKKSKGEDNKIIPSFINVLESLAGSEIFHYLGKL